MRITQIVASAVLALILGALAIAPTSISLPILGWLAAAIGAGVIAGTAMDRMGRGPRIVDLGQSHAEATTHG